MKTSDFYYDLPQELIAQTPLERRDGSRLLTLNRETGETEHHHFYELPRFLHPGDCLVLNSVANVEKAMKHLDGYGRIDCYLDRDEAGRRTLATLQGHYGERVCDRSFLYDGCKDLNEYLQLATKKAK